MLFVQSNYKWHAIIILLPWGSIRREPTPTPSLFLEPLKYKVHMLGLVSSKAKPYGIGTVSELLLVSTFVQSSNIV